jgi:hypothetical protein
MKGKEIKKQKREWTIVAFIFCFYERKKKKKQKKENGRSLHALPVRLVPWPANSKPIAKPLSTSFCRMTGGPHDYCSSSRARTPWSRALRTRPTSRARPRAVPRIGSSPATRTDRAPSHTPCTPGQPKQRIRPTEAPRPFLPM